LSPPAPAPPVAARRPPTALERLVALRDGGLVRLRHLEPEDGRDEVALAAEVGGRVVGVARYARDSTAPDAEVTVSVEDGHRGRGIGTLLVGELAELAAHDAVNLSGVPTRS